MHCVVQVGSATKYDLNFSNVADRTTMLGMVAYLGARLEVCLIASLALLLDEASGQRQRRFPATTDAPAQASFAELPRAAHTLIRIVTARLPRVGGERTCVVEPLNDVTAHAHS